jgi:hypothetical protein
LPVPAKDAIVIYLAGREDLDRPIAISKGFKPHNLFAVERDKCVVRALRGSGVLTVSGDLINALDSWTGPGHVIFADLCSGLSTSFCSLLAALVHKPHFRRSVIAVNLMRGRDPFWVVNFQTPIDETEAFKQSPLEAFNTKHRAKCVMLNTLATIRAFTLGYITLKQDPVTKEHRWQKREPHAKGTELWERFKQNYGEYIAPWFTSYKSTSGQVFDSGVWRNPSLVLWGEFVGQFKADELAKIVGSVNMKDPMSRQLLALKATRTRYMNR